MTSMVMATTQRYGDQRRRSETARLFDEAASADTPQARERILDEIVLVNIELARSLARRYRNRGVPLDDLEQVALLTLVRIVPKFDPAQGRDFLAYAVPSVRGDLKRYFRDHGWTIRPPRRVQEIQLKVQQAHTLSREAGRPASIEQIAEELDLKTEDVREALEAEGCFQPLSLDVPISADNVSTSLGDTLSHTEDRAFQAAEARALLEPLMVGLSQRDRLILRRRFVEGKTQQEIADELGVTQMQVSRLLTRILRDLRDRAGDMDLESA